MEPSTIRCTGLVVAWKDDKRYGFAENLDDNNERVFIHFTNTVNKTHLQVGDVISFILGQSPSHPGKTCAKEIRLIKRAVNAPATVAPAKDVQ